MSSRVHLSLPDALVDRLHEARGDGETVGMVIRRLLGDQLGVSRGASGSSATPATDERLVALEEWVERVDKRLSRLEEMADG